MPTEDDERTSGERPPGSGRSDQARERDRARRRRDQDEYDDRDAPEAPRSRPDQDEYDDRDERGPGRRRLAPVRPSIRGEPCP